MEKKTPTFVLIFLYTMLINSLSILFDDGQDTNIIMIVGLGCVGITFYRGR